ncbi:uncharacterized protein V1513DRAFT_442083 [Lipomyces chichibuensis]|uniref:uncharacterized protein n=1 Tax=Lipomyces chichibuensis TaxID=1546026 RepID=UPI003343947C
MPDRSQLLGQQMLGPFGDIMSPVYSEPFNDTDSDDRFDISPSSSNVYHCGSARSKRDRASTERLNHILYHLNDIFPDTEVDLLRKLMTDQRGPSQLYAIVEMLLSSPTLLASRRRSRHAFIDDWEHFRTKEYHSAVTRILCAHFKSLHRSTIDNVLSQNNYSFSLSFEELDKIAIERAGRWSFMKLFRRNRTLPALDVASLIGNTGSPELDAELVDIDRPRREGLVAKDEQAAREANLQEYEKEGQLIECECCFGDYAWEDLTCCSEGHFFCRNCLINSVKEGLYGQGTLRGKSVVRCISASAAPECEAGIAICVLRATIPSQLYTEFERAQASDFFSKNATVKGYVVCPFCNYAEESSAAVLGRNGEFRYAWSIAMIPRILVTIHVKLIILMFLVFVGLTYYVISRTFSCLPEKAYKSTFGVIDDWIETEFTTVLRGVFRKRHGTAFHCKNPACLRTSCTECQKEFLPFHKCYEDEESRMRVYIEKAMADAVKRTCPHCRISFIKSEGCNKLVCVCGYAMCYVCRKDIREEGYQHFCEHFRPIPGRVCTECDKCDLYKVEDESQAALRAAKEAEEEFIRTNGVPSGMDLKGKVIGPGGHEVAVNRGVLKTAESWFVDFADIIIEA